MFISYCKTFKMSKNTRNNKEINNVKLTNSFQTSATANDIEDTTDDVSNTIFHQPANEKDIVILSLENLWGKRKEKRP